MGTSTSTSIPLDIFLMRAHALPLPYLVSPSVSFLTYVSPSAYLSLLRSPPPPSNHASRPGSHSTPVDVPLDYLRHALLSQSKPHGVTVATLVLSTVAPDSINAESGSVLPHNPDPLVANDHTGSGIRPTFSLVSSSTPPPHKLPQAQSQAGVSSSSYKWMLDFTSGGSYPGVIMSQTRMRAIEVVVDQSSMNRLDPMAGMHLMSYGTGSWVDLLVSFLHPLTAR